MRTKEVSIIQKDTMQRSFLVGSGIKSHNTHNHMEGRPLRSSLMSSLNKQRNRKQK